MIYVAICLLVCFVLPVCGAMVVAGKETSCTAFDEAAIVCPCLQCTRGKYR